MTIQPVSYTTTRREWTLPAGTVPVTDLVTDLVTAATVAENESKRIKVADHVQITVSAPYARPENGSVVVGYQVEITDPGAPEQPVVVPLSEVTPVPPTPADVAAKAKPAPEQPAEPAAAAK
jgi:hypothetical protein